MFWIWYKNNVDNTLIFWLLLISASHKSKSIFHALPVEAQKKKEAWPEQVTSTGQRDISYHRTSCSIDTSLRKSLRRGADCSLGMGLASVSEW